MNISIWILWIGLAAAGPNQLTGQVFQDFESCWQAANIAAESVGENSVVYCENPLWEIQAPEIQH